MRMRFPLGLILALVPTILSLGACSANSRASADAPDAGPIAECEAFLTAYEHCLASLGPAEIARDRVAQTRAALEAQTSNEARAALRMTCSRNLTQLSSSCR